jgi:hypothetical protein
MFKELKDYSIKIRNNKENSLRYLPNIISMEPVDCLLDATKWIVDEAYKDYMGTNKIIEDRRKVKGVSQENIDDYDTLRIRLGSRTQGYVNQLCLIEDILVFEYKRMDELLREASDSHIFLDPENDYKELRNRFKPIRTFRNKVIAHTAYTYSKPEDNPETVVRSILNLFPSPTKITVGDNYFNGFSKYKSQLPIITIFGWYEQIEPIFLDWKMLFVEKIEKINKKLPFNTNDFEIEVAYPHKINKKKN